MWIIKLKAKKWTNKRDKQKNLTDTQQYGVYQREEDRGLVKGKGGQIYGHIRRFDFGSFTRNAIYR